MIAFYMQKIIIQILLAPFLRESCDTEALIQNWVPQYSKVIDLGCGDEPC